MSELAVRVTDLCHAYDGAGGPQSILNGVQLEVPAGETLALLGASGSGKSTLLNLIGGLEPIQSGEVQVFGHSLSQLGDHARTLLRRDTIGFVHQAFNLIPTLSVADNVTLPLALSGMAMAERQRQASSLLAAVDLADRDAVWPDRLSGGEQQRVAIARALAAQPPLILADEPTGNLDAQNGARVMQLLTDLVRNHQTTLIIVTHSREVASRCDRILTLVDTGLADVGAGDQAAW